MSVPNIIPPADRTVDLDELTRVFPQECIRYREGGRGKQLAYLDQATVVRRLNKATGNNWSFLVDRIWNSDDGKMQFALVTITLPGHGSRQHVGVQKLDDRSGEDAMAKGAISDALKKAASLFGVGLELYGQDNDREHSEPSAPITRADGTTPMNRPPGTPRAPETNGSGQEPIATEARKAFYKAALESGYDVNVDGTKQCAGDKLFHVAYCAHKDNGVEITEKAVKSPKMWADATSLLPAYTAKMAAAGLEPADMSSLAFDTDPDPVNYTTERPNGGGARR